MKIYTKTGDTGKTSLYDGTRVDKTTDVIKCLGKIDTLNSALGCVRERYLCKGWFDQLKASMLGLSDWRDVIDDMIDRIQGDLLRIGSHIATQDPNNRHYQETRFPDGEEAFLEREIDLLESILPPLRVFIKPDNMVHLARSFCREAELAVWFLPETSVVIYLNRLSDYLFMLGRYISMK